MLFLALTHRGKMYRAKDYALLVICYFLLLLVCFGGYKLLNFFERKNKESLDKKYNAVCDRYYEMGRELYKSGAPYQPLNNGKPPKGSFARAMWPVANSEHKRGYDEAAKEAESTGTVIQTSR